MQSYGTEWDEEVWNKTQKSYYFSVLKTFEDIVLQLPKFSCLKGQTLLMTF